MKKETKITQKITYISNDIDVKDWEDAYEEYKEECEDNDETPDDIYTFAERETNLNMEEDIYTLSGQKVKQPRQLPKGVYIIRSGQQYTKTFKR